MLNAKHLLSLVLFAGNAVLSSAQEKRSCQVDHTPPTEADRAIFRHELPAAEQLYLAQLKDNPQNTAAASGLVRTLLAEGRINDALTLVRKQLADHPNDVRIQTVFGETEMRRGEPEEALQAFNTAMQLDPCQARLHLDVAHYQNLIAMRASARRQIELAHTLAPEDLVINRAWRAETAVPLPPEQIIARLEQRRDAPDATPEQKSGAAEAIKAIQARQRGDCQATADIASTTLKMMPISNGPAHPLYAVGLDVEMNGKRKRLEIDTGASGLLISRSSAVSAGLVPEAEIKAGGIGDGGLTGAFVTHVDHLRIGNMEFRNCMVRVLEKKSALDVDGLIGTDVFRNYLVTLDTPAREIRLAPLPPRPDDSGKTEALATTGESSEADSPSAGQPAPKDRYISPDMKDWTSIYRVGHQLIVPTRIGNAPTKLFILDTGSAAALISPEAAREVTHVNSDDRTHVHGISGDVKNVSEADSVTIRFAHVQQQLRGMVSIDTSGVSRSTGLEIAGFLAFPTLSELIISVDYRDNLIHVVYDPNHGFHAR